LSNVETYLFFNGNCGEAMRFYERTLGGKLEMMKAKDSPAAGKTPPGTEDKILHSRLAFDGGVLMASDWMDTKPYPGMGGFSVSVAHPKVEDAKRVYDALSKGGQVSMPLGKTFWVEAFGMVVDRFGTPWMISGGKASS
jgi:PhnB protein